MRRAPVAALLLAAPLFVVSRSHGAELPRLTGTLIAPGERTALFAEPGGIMSVGVGDPLGEYRVSRIEPGRVQLDKDDQRVTVSVEAATAPVRDPGGVTFGLVLRQPSPADD